MLRADLERLLSMAHPGAAADAAGDAGELPWLAVLFGQALGRFATRDEAIAAVDARDRVNLATVRNLETKEIWRRLKYGRFTMARGD